MAAKKPAGIDMERNYVCHPTVYLSFIIKSVAVIAWLSLWPWYTSPWSWPWTLIKSLALALEAQSLLTSLLCCRCTDFSHSLLKYQNLSAKLRHYNQSAFIHYNGDCNAVGSISIFYRGQFVCQTRSQSTITGVDKGGQPPPQWPGGGISIRCPTCIFV